MWLHIKGPTSTESVEQARLSLEQGYPAYNNDLHAFPHTTYEHMICLEPSIANGPCVSDGVILEVIVTRSLIGAES